MSKPFNQRLEEAVNFIWRMFIDGCDAPMTVWIETMWKPLGQLILAWYTIDLMNIFTAWLRPVGRPLADRKTRHIGGGKKGRRGGLRSLPGKIVGFDPGEFIGEQIWGGEELRHRPVPPGVVYMWSLFGVIERFNYFFMVLDLGSDFIVNWMSSIVELGYCGNKDDSVLLAVKPWAQQVGIFGWSAVVWDHTEKNRKLTFWNGVGFNQITGPGVTTARMDVKCLETISGPGVCGLRLRCLGGPSVDREAVETIELPEGGSGAMSITTDIQPGDLWIVEIIVGGIWEFTDMEFFAQAPWRPYQ